MTSLFNDPFVDAGLAPRATAHLLALDQDLARDVPVAEFERASELAWARVLTIDGDGVRFPAAPRRFEGWLGLLLLDGFAVRRDDEPVAHPELLGPGDVIPPWAMRSVPGAPEPDATAYLQGIGPVRIALLDRDFEQRTRPWPQIGCALLDRAVARSILRAVQRDIRAARGPAPERVWRLLLHAAARWGEPTRRGVRLPPPLLSQRMLATLLDLSPAATAEAVALLLADGRLSEDPVEGWLAHPTAP